MEANARGGIAGLRMAWRGAVCGGRRARALASVLAGGLRGGAVIMQCRMDRPAARDCSQTRDDLHATNSVQRQAWLDRSSRLRHQMPEAVPVR